MTTPAGSDGANGGAAGAAGAAGGQQGGQAAQVEYKFDPIEGVTKEFDDDVIATAKDMGWDQATAAKYRAREAKLALDELKADGESRAQKQAADKIAKEQADTQRKQAWEKANRDDPEFGGQKYHETTQRVEQMFAMAGERGKALLKEMGESAPDLLSNPAFRNFLAFHAYQRADGKFHEGSPAGKTDGPKTFADVAYGDKYPAAARS
jgi:hypothetical protein